jgi:hypothetical protein
MKEPLNFHYPLNLLLKEGDLILTAAEQNAVALAERLPDPFLADTRTLLTKVGCDQTDQKSAAGGLGTLTLAQDAAAKVMRQIFADAKETAKKAFKGNDVKLREEFQVGIDKPHGLDAVLGRARIVLASLKNPANIPALSAKGWIASDTAKLEAALGALTNADNTQEDAKGDKLKSTGTRNRDANDLDDRIETIQHAAHLHYPENDPANAGIRAKFRLGIFPPAGGSAKPPTPPAPPAQ